MKKSVCFSAIVIIIIFFASQSFAQKNTSDSSKMYSVSGFGYGFTSGKIHDILRPQFSSNLGIEFRPKRSDWFVSAVLDLISYGYYQNYSDQPGNLYRIKYGSSTFYMFEVAPGYRFNGKLFSFYLFAGPGIGLINLPNITVNNALYTATQTNKYSWTASAEGGLGLDANLGSGFTIFLQGRYMYNFSKVQNQQVNLFPVFAGVKSNISAILFIFGAKKP